MDPATSPFVGAFLGAALGLPAGFLIIEIIKRAMSDKEDPIVEAIEWAIASAKAKVLDQHQVASVWIRTYDLEEALGASGAQALPARFATQIVGTSEAHPPLIADDIDQAAANQQKAIRQVRKLLGMD
jgi:hypothetical protein